MMFGSWFCCCSNFYPVLSNLFRAPVTRRLTGYPDLVSASYNSSVESYSHEVNTVVTGDPEKGTPLTEKTEGLKSGGEVGKMDDKDLASAEEKKDTITKHPTDDNLKWSGSSEGSLSNSESEAVIVNDECASNSKGNDSHGMQNEHQSQSFSTVAKTFICNEMFDGKMVNVVDGLKLHEGLFDDTEVSKPVSLVNDLKVSGKKGQFQGKCTMCVLPSCWKIPSLLPFFNFT